jgi:hypothetical protein
MVKPYSTLKGLRLTADQLEDHGTAIRRAHQVRHPLKGGVLFQLPTDHPPPHPFSAALTA